MHKECFLIYKIEDVVIKNSLFYPNKNKKGNNADKAVMFWKCCEHSFDKLPKEYDVAIAYAQGTPTFYVADKVKAKKKWRG